ncbi:MAG: isoprenylcysteine carboxylmethyltransferase family protein [Bacteroidales bacterium]|jgi:protein-S-isoprenylcysteine O-methyltransferase Ste14|nr:isoprenylcysteine carboxylmethyltransferase family protein [Bacteroidales bacterium]
MNKEKSIITPRLVIMLLLAVVVIPMLPLLVSRHWNWIEAWIYAAICILGFIISRMLAARRNLGLLAERSRFGQQSDAKSWDRTMTALLTLGGLIIHLVPGLDRLKGWSDGFSRSWVVVGFVLVLAGYLLGSYALIANRYFSGMVRIQTDRDHKVVSSGPYRWVRHPGYLGAAMTYAGIPFFLDSAWTLIPVAVTIGILVVRTSLEDRTLQSELPGYNEYARHTHYRLFPGIW